MIFGKKQSDLARALVLHLGFDLTPAPQEDFARVEAKLGKKRAEKVRPQLDRVLDQLARLQPNWDRMTLDEAAHWAAAELQERWPELDARAYAAIVWAASYGWK